MRHVLFALFDDDTDAERCLHAVRALPGLSEACTVLLHHDKVNRHDVPLAETSAREGVATGALVGSAAGGLLGGLVLGPLGFIAAGPLTAALFGMLGGGAAGALGGGLTGAGKPDPVIEDVEREVKAGKVLLTVEVENMDQADEAEQICLAHNGRIARKPLFGFWSHRLHRRDVA
ncbi:hypothetical protein [Polyangium jinanense]|uniref:DUF1269 domain-containing protein n=1 Tax=Polyangium jinanense TaxID=2829994 RepID=A0A9X3X6C9_9BACT|nr:hypothetical protein [Polyangium jinanense]MDC3958235.1 hypothetical protein [Polyangium jinanense]MDC3983430.1 hypothetical protein [Polyangium jinanense]